MYANGQTFGNGEPEYYEQQYINTRTECESLQNRIVNMARLLGDCRDLISQSLKERKILLERINYLESRYKPETNEPDETDKSLKKQEYESRLHYKNENYKKKFLEQRKRLKKLKHDLEIARQLNKRLFEQYIKLYQKSESFHSITSAPVAVVVAPNSAKKNKNYCHENEDSTRYRTDDVTDMDGKTRHERGAGGDCQSESECDNKETNDEDDDDDNDPIVIPKSIRFAIWDKKRTKSLCNDKSCHFSCSKVCRENISNNSKMKLAKDNIKKTSVEKSLNGNVDENTLGKKHNRNYRHKTGERTSTNGEDSSIPSIISSGSSTRLKEIKVEYDKRCKYIDLKHEADSFKHSLKYFNRGTNGANFKAAQNRSHSKILEELQSLINGEKENSCKNKRYINSANPLYNERNKKHQTLSKLNELLKDLKNKNDTSRLDADEDDEDASNEQELPTSSTASPSNSSQESFEENKSRIKFYEIGSNNSNNIVHKRPNAHRHCKYNKNQDNFLRKVTIEKSPIEVSYRRQNKFNLT
ncbi:hypothetical protein HELRODRAFT_162288 [Helobdella robusta]|uniref:Uncharacterized protein n=1 Tax=Helobdella robusta TaxID=6412 RepID=T1ESG5_HELRO|nr:hypothetical protein HELRODRAFT_162288 [Helobdella robusta]ESN98829.1 hypothetical protein HELRODRAFT_162288 [Helobdella robusta]